MSVSIVGVVGAGFMGSGIAESVAFAGKHAVLYEPEQGPLDRSRDGLAASLAKSVSRGRLTREEASEIADRVVYTTRFEDLTGSDAVVEAITENLAIKGELFERLDVALPNAQFLASNTSSIPIAELAARTSRPERVLGLHFFSPVPVMKLVEVVIALDTSREAVDVAEEFAGELGKQPIETKDRSGFIVNMLLIPYLVAAVRMFEDGFATREDIDIGMKLGCGHPMGPLTLCDFIGLDVIYAVCDSLYEEFKRPEYAPPPLLSRMLASGRLGRKSGRGFYDYAETPATVAA
ncbi:MAG TPA: 3-hydroxybutyryl-CoA dehydrogenase [Solirubrobacteraceae bacterium]|jgi:3-hydroxybutyryl-CoA dehydrogenase|nr:3-hydroxybutyryl-CoA dehydrogenase [Solirubrobacteraceae bacterium]